MQQISYRNFCGTRFNYERKEHIDYLDNLVKEGTYQDYQNAIHDMKENLLKELKNKGLFVGIVVDQADDICYGDIMFPLSKDLDTLELNAEKIIQVLKELDIEQDFSCLYYNTALCCFMYTVVAIKASDSPDMYHGIDRDKFIMR